VASKARLTGKGMGCEESQVQVWLRFMFKKIK